MNIIESRLRTLLIELFGLPERELHPGVSFAELDVDSLTLIEFSLAIEKEFAIAIGPDDIELEHTLGSVARMVLEKSPATSESS